MEIETRRASTDDMADLTRIRMMAHGGFNEALYEGLGHSIEEIIESELSNPELTDYFRNYWLAQSRDKIVGGLLAFPFDDFENDTRNPLVPEERFLIDEPFDEIEAPGTYYVHALSVFPEFTRQGIGSVLLELAKAHAIDKGFAELSLYVFAKNSGAVSLYEKHGYREVDRRLLIPHPRMVYSGDVLLMICPV